MQDILTSIETLEESMEGAKSALEQKGVTREKLQVVDLPKAISEIRASDDTFSVFGSSEVREALEEGYNGAV